MNRHYISIAVVMCLAAAAAAQQPTTTDKQLDKRATVTAPALSANSDSRRFVFTLAETDHGKRINSRDFEVLARENRTTTLDQGSRIPVVTSADKTGAVAQYQYIDVGLNLH